MVPEVQSGDCPDSSFPLQAVCAIQAWMSRTASWSNQVAILSLKAAPGQQQQDLQTSDLCLQTVPASLHHQDAWTSVRAQAVQGLE